MRTIAPQIPPHIHFEKGCIKLTNTCIPSTSGANYKLPFGAVIEPLAATEEPISVIGSPLPVRCSSCHSYVNAFTPFIEGGNKWVCNICRHLNRTKNEYYSPLTGGMRADIDTRPELLSNIYELKAPSDYSSRPPQPPVFSFVFDATPAAVKSGLLKTATKAASAALKRGLEKYGSRLKTCFVVFDRSIHFFRFSKFTGVKMCTTPETDEVYIPFPSGLIVEYADFKANVDLLLSSLPSMFEKKQSSTAAPIAGVGEKENSFGSAILGCCKTMMNIGGKVSYFLSSIPSRAIGALSKHSTTRINQGTLGANMIPKTLGVAEDLYRNLAVEAASRFISIDGYICSSSYCDVATLSVLSRVTGGQVRLFPSFVAERDGERLFASVLHSMEREQAFEAMFRVRVSRGLEIAKYCGHGHTRPHDLFAVSSCDEDWGVGLQLRVASAIPPTMSLTGSDGAYGGRDSRSSSSSDTSYACVGGRGAPIPQLVYGYVQSSLLYTTPEGERRVRVCTVPICVSEGLGDVFASAQMDNVIALMSKLHINRLRDDKIVTVRKRILTSVAETLAAYRKLGATSLAPRAMSLLPLYVLSLLKSPSLRTSGGEKLDVRSMCMSEILRGGVDAVKSIMYARCWCVWKSGELSSRPAMAPMPVGGETPAGVESGGFIDVGGSIGTREAAGVSDEGFLGDAECAEQGELKDKW
ncbi:Protein transport protein Sec24-like At3g07100, partial [Aduncisulcus paluster]